MGGEEDNGTMPELPEVDALVDSIYSKKPYETDEQRLSDLFAMYERMTAEEAAKAPATKSRKAAK